MSFAPAVSTSEDLDNAQTRERARRADDDARAAQHDAGAPDDAEARGRAGEALDASIAAARAATEEADDVPILLRDPVTGQIVKGG